MSGTHLAALAQLAATARYFYCLYINNWNENRLNEIEVRNTLEQIKTAAEILTFTEYLDKVSEGKFMNSSTLPISHGSQLLIVYQ